MTMPLTWTGTTHFEKLLPLKIASPPPPLIDAVCFKLAWTRASEVSQVLNKSQDRKHSGSSDHNIMKIGNICEGKTNTL